MRPSGRALDLGFAALAAAQLGAAACLVPVAGRVHLPDGSPLVGSCLLHEIGGVACPFCGMTRSFVALAHGELGAALRFHPAGPLLFSAMAAFLVGAVVIACRRSQPLLERRRFLRAFEVVLLVSLAIGICKMMRS